MLTIAMTTNTLNSALMEKLRAFAMVLPDVSP
jgi:hypothetical protein